MNNAQDAVSMSQRIFSMDLPVETVSLYLLCCALVDAGAAVNRDNLIARWNGSTQALDREIASLQERNIICRSESPDAAPASYRLMADTAWR